MSAPKLLPRRLDRQVILLVGLLLTLVMPIFAVHEAQENAERLVESATTQARALAENIAVTSVEAIVLYDFASTEQLLLRSARFPGVLEIQVTDSSGRIVGDVFTGRGGAPQIRYNVQRLALPANMRFQQLEEKGVLTIWEPIDAARPVGWVRLKYSLAEAEGVAQEYLYDYLGDGAIMTILVVVLILLIMRSPLRMLRSAATFAGALKNKSGEQMPVHCRSIEIEQLGNALNAASTSLCEQEITRKRIEAELEQKAHSLEQMTDHLEELVKRRTVELEAANAQLRHLNKVKSDFVSVVSHELRTPLTSIKSFSEILKDDVEDLDIDSQRHFLSIISEESDRLGRLINDLLDLQKMDSGKMMWKDAPVELVRVLQSSVEFFSQAYSDKGLWLRLVPSTECVLNLDVDRIKQLIANLFSNALKFTERGGVTVTIDIDSDHVKVTVTDTGVGIAEAEVGKVFDTFHQVDSSETRKIGGSGLGLAICKEIVEHYGGWIWVESILGQGSSFSFTLPLAHDSAQC